VPIDSAHLPPLWCRRWCQKALPGASPGRAYSIIEGGAVAGIRTVDHRFGRPSKRAEPAPKATPVPAPVRIEPLVTFPSSTSQVNAPISAPATPVYKPLLTTL